MVSLKALLAVLLVGLPAIPLAAGGDCAGTRSAPVHDGSVTYTDFAAMNTSHIRTGPDGSARLDNSGYAMLGENIVHQGPGDQTAPSLGALAGGGYAVAWMDDRGAGYDIYAAVLDRAGRPAGAPAAVCTAAGDQEFPSVAALPGGGFAVAWQDGRGGQSTDIYARIFDRNGTGVLGEFAVCTAAGAQADPRLAAYANGSFLVAWDDLRNGLDSDIFARRFGPGGANPGPEIAISQAQRRQDLPDVAVGAGGTALVVWQDDRDGSSMNIFAQRLDGNGTAAGGAFRLAGGSWDTWSPSVAALPAGGFAVAWEDLRNQAKTGSDIHAHLLDANGTKVGNDIRVSDGESDEYYPDIAVGSGGNITIVWEQLSDEGDRDIAGRVFDPNGTTLEVLDIVTAVADQELPAVAAGPGNELLATWGDNRNNDWDIYSRGILNPHWNGGNITTGDIRPSALWAWDRLCLTAGFEDPANNTVSSEFSPDGGKIWSEVPGNGSLAEAGRPPELRFRFTLGTHANSTTPVLYSATVSWKTNLPPSARLPEDFSAFRNSLVTIEAAAADGDNDTLGFSWAQTAGAPVNLSGNGTASVSFRPNRSGVYSFRVSAGDGYEYSSDSINVTVRNRSPVASPPAEAVAWKKEAVVIGANVSDPDGDLLYFAWNWDPPFGMVMVSGGDELTLIPDRAGVYKVRVVASDGENSSAPAFINLTVRNRPPAAGLTVDSAFTFIGAPVMFNASSSFDRDGRVDAYNFSFGDGSSTGWVADPAAAYAYSAPGNYNAVVLVRDDDGDAAPSPPLNISVKAPLPPLSPTIRIISPAEGQIIATRQIVVQFSVENFTLSAGGDHVHYQLDEGPEVMWYSPAPFTLTALSDGPHLVRASLENSTHSRLAGPGAVAAVNFTVSPAGLPDLSITRTDISLAPAAPRDGETVRIRVSVRNIGDAAAANFTVRLLADGSAIADLEVKGLGRGQAGVVEFSWKAREGTHSLRTVADPANLLDELNETNNGATANITVERSAREEPWTPYIIVGGLIFILAVGATLARNIRKK